MSTPVSLKSLRREEPVWIFPWRPRRESQFPKWFAVTLVAALFTLMVTSLRITVVPVAPWSARKASVIQVLDDTVGRELTLRAREGGPFPSRFEPSLWPTLAGIESAALAATRTSLPPYQPALRALPPEHSEPPSLSRPGRVVLPSPPTGPTGEDTPAAATPLRTVPVILPLSGITAAGLPADLPNFDGSVSPAIAAEPPRFLVRLSPAGEVLDCIPLDANEDSAALTRWLRALRFPADTQAPQRWIAIGVTFTNRPADGTDPR